MREMLFIGLLVEVQSFRSAIAVELCPGFALSKARREAAFGEIDVQVEAAVGSDALKRKASGLVFDFKEDPTN